MVRIPKLWSHPTNLSVFVCFFKSDWGDNMDREKAKYYKTNNKVFIADFDI